MSTTKGLSPTLLRQMSSVCIRFTCYGAVMDYLKEAYAPTSNGSGSGGSGGSGGLGDKQPYWHAFLSGSCCGLMNVLLNQVKTYMYMYLIDIVRP